MVTVVNLFTKLDSDIPDFIYDYKKKNGNAYTGEKPIEL